MTETKKSNGILYEIYDDHAFGISDTRTAFDETVIHFSPNVNGYMLIGPFTFDIQNGVCRPDIRCLDDGVHSVSVHTDNSVISADSITRSGRRIFLTPKGDFEIRALRAELILLKKELKKANDRILKIEHRINGSSVL